jgi:Glucose dehydrogenase
MAQENDWWTFHGDLGRTGNIPGSKITAANVNTLKKTAALQLGGPILSTPAIAGGYVYVGTANSVTPQAGNSTDDGGYLHKIALSSGEITHTFFWPTDADEGDTHGFCGMGCTPAVVDGFVYFSAFNGCVYCLNADDLTQVWVVNLRNTDSAHNQPINNDNGESPKAEGWSSPLVVNGRIYVGIGEGENPNLYAFIFCLDSATGNVVWVYCTNQYEGSQPNPVNQLPRAVVPSGVPSGYTIFEGAPVTLGCSVWTAISYDEDLKRIYATTGNPTPIDNGLPAVGWSYGILSLDAITGEYRGFYQADAKSSYRPSDIDVDFGAAPVVFTRNGQKVVAAACKNGALFIVDADTMEPVVGYRQLLPYMNNGDQIPTVDPHGPDTATNPNPVIPNEESNKHPAENFYGTYSTPAIHPGTQRIFVGVGGNNYHYVAPGIDYKTTPFMRALDWNTLDDAWELSNEDPKRYVKPSPPMYQTVAESGLSSPAVVNDVVFCSTSKIALYAFSVADGTPLWSTDIGDQTGGFNGGYGYCLGPAVSGDYVVVGSLIYGSDGGILQIFQLDGGK